MLWLQDHSVLHFHTRQPEVALNDNPCSAAVCVEVMSSCHTMHACMQVLEAIFVFCCVWSIGACVVQKPGCEDRDR